MNIDIRTLGQATSALAIGMLLRIIWYYFKAWRIAQNGGREVLKTALELTILLLGIQVTSLAFRFSLATQDVPIQNRDYLALAISLGTIYISYRILHTKKYWLPKD